ncbi:hypothetical protein [Algisphaera agarilytica]|uniref:Uncharacterized protein n=1 Tax=Algisphaera agarilytica TaxID=1385975 RepID=A0A7X0LLK8_9BACT|nr:hypothetical protein [Algisphaera agarilytica]MBB6430741.1 hypothetical protein [Algisphaera agarilytica]
MKSLLAAFIILILIHLILAVGFVGWLKASNRLDGERVQAVVEMFKPTIAEVDQLKAEAEAAEAEAAAARDQLMRLESVAKGPQTLEDRLAQNFEADEFDLHRLERLNAETEAIRRRLDQDKALIAQEWAALQEQQAIFEEMVKVRTASMRDEDFDRAVKTLEQLPPKQAKGVVQQYIADGQMEEVVDYLAAMQLRKSAGILKAFKSEEDIPQAAEILEQLRTRGKDPFGQATAGGTSEQPQS